MRRGVASHSAPVRPRPVVVMGGVGGDEYLYPKEEGEKKEKKEKKKKRGSPSPFLPSFLPLFLPSALLR